MVQSNLTGKTEQELETESLYRERMKLYDELTRDLIKNNGDTEKCETLTKRYRQNVYAIDNKIRRLSSNVF